MKVQSLKTSHLSPIHLRPHQYYYRLKQIDKDDKFQYSAIRMVQLEADAFAWIQLRPNPADKILQVVFSSRFDAGKAVIKITDAKGVLVLTKQEELIAGRTIDLTIYSLPAGQYFLYVTDDKGKIYSKAFAKR